MLAWVLRRKRTPKKVSLEWRVSSEPSTTSVRRARIKMLARRVLATPLRSMVREIPVKWLADTSRRSGAGVCIICCRQAQC